jgi:hypothetical protein
MPLETCQALTKQADAALEGALAFLPLLEWYYAARLRRIVGDGPLRKKTQ